MNSPTYQNGAIGFDPRPYQSLRRGSVPLISPPFTTKGVENDGKILRWTSPKRGPGGQGCRHSASGASSTQNIPMFLYGWLVFKLLPRTIAWVLNCWCPPQKKEKTHKRVKKGHPQNNFDEFIHTRILHWNPPRVHEPSSRMEDAQQGGAKVAQRSEPVLGEFLWVSGKFTA